MSTTLPPDWADFLTDVNQRLEEAVMVADARSAQAPALDAVQWAEERHRDVAHLAACLQGLGTRLESAQRLVEEVDVALQTGEELLRRQAASCGAVRQRLAEWAGRAIG